MQGDDKEDDDRIELEMETRLYESERRIFHRLPSTRPRPERPEPPAEQPADEPDGRADE
jgi:hypothetical protein